MLTKLLTISGGSRLFPCSFSQWCRWPARRNKMLSKCRETHGMLPLLRFIFQD